MHHHGHAGCHLPQALRQLPQRQQLPADAAPGGLVGLAHIEQQQWAAALLPGLQLVGRDFGGAGRGGFQRRFAAEGGVVGSQRGELLVGRHGPEADGLEAHAQGIDQQQAAAEHLPDFKNNFERLVGLHGADEARQHAQHADFGAARGLAGGGRLGIKAAVRWPALVVEHRHLPFELENGPEHQRLAQQHTGIIHEVASGEIIGAVYHQVIMGKQGQGIGRRQQLLVRFQRNERVLGAQLFGGHQGFGAAHVGGGVQHLALQVTGIHHVEIEQAQGAHAGGGQVLQHRAAQPAAAHHQHAGRFQLVLAGRADFGQQ